MSENNEPIFSVLNGKTEYGFFDVCTQPGEPFGPAVCAEVGANGPCSGENSVLVQGGYSSAEDCCGDYSAQAMNCF